MSKTLWICYSGLNRSRKAADLFGGDYIGYKDDGFCKVCNIHFEKIIYDDNSIHFEHIIKEIEHHDIIIFLDDDAFYYIMRDSYFSSFWQNKKVIYKNVTDYDYSDERLEIELKEKFPEFIKGGILNEI